MVSSTVRAAGDDLDDFTASHSTVKRHRKLEQADQASTIRKSFEKMEWLA